MKLPRAYCCLLVAMLACSPTASIAASPEDVVKSYFDFLMAGDSRSAVDLVVPEAVREYRDMFWPVVVQATSEDQGVVLGRIFGKEATIASVEELDDLDFMASCLRFMFRNIGEVEEFKITVLGSVLEDEDTAHVVIRSQVIEGDFSANTLEVISCKKGIDNEWGVTLSKQVSGLVQIMQKNLGKQ